MKCRAAGTAAAALCASEAYMRRRFAIVRLRRGYRELLQAAATCHAALALHCGVKAMSNAHHPQRVRTSS